MTTCDDAHSHTRTLLLLHRFSRSPPPSATQRNSKPAPFIHSRDFIQLSPSAHMTILRCKVAIVGSSAGTSPSVASRSVAASASAPVGRCLFTHRDACCSLALLLVRRLQSRQVVPHSILPQGKTVQQELCDGSTTLRECPAAPTAVGSAPGPGDRIRSHSMLAMLANVHMFVSRLLALSSS